MDIIQVITKELNVEKWQVEAAVKMCIRDSLCDPQTCGSSDGNHLDDPYDLSEYETRTV